MRSTNPATSVIVGGALLLAAGGVRAQDWPQWRGPHQDNKVTGFMEPKTWPRELTKKWQVKVGLGDASPVLVGDKVYVFTRQDNDECVLCLDVGSGKEIWKEKYSAPGVRGPASGHPGPRGTPAVGGGKVCTLGVGGALCCWDAATGKQAWRKDSQGVPGFSAAASPLILDGLCIAFLGGAGKGEVVAIDLASGAEKWKWTGEGPAYGSPVVMTVGDSKQIVTPTERSLVGIDATSGKQLWQVAYRSRYNSGTPVVEGSTVIYSAPAGGGRGGGGGGGGAGASGTVAYQIEKKDDGFTAKELWKKPLAADIYNTPLLKDGLLYGLTSQRGQGPSNLFCMDAKSGETVWTDSKQSGECGAVLDAGSVLLALSSDGNLLVLKPGKEQTEVARYRVAESAPWTVPILAGNRIFVKDRDSLTLWTIE